MTQNSKPELAKYLHAEHFSPTTSSILKAMKQGVLKTWPGLAEKLIKKKLEKLRNTMMGHLNMRRHGLQSIKDKPPDIDPEEKTKTSVVYFTTVEPSTTKESISTQIYADISPPLQVGGTNTSM